MIDDKDIETTHPEESGTGSGETTEPTDGVQKPEVEEADPSAGLTGGTVKESVVMREEEQEDDFEEPGIDEGEEEEGKSKGIHTSGGVDQQNIAMGNININNYSRSEREKNDDPIFYLDQQRPARIEPFPYADDEEKMKIFLERRIIFIDCMEKEVARSFLYEAKNKIHQSYKKQYRIGQVSFGDELKRERSTFQQLFLNENGIAVAGDGLICFVHIDKYSSKNFFQTFLDIDGWVVSSTLRERKIFIVFYLDQVAAEQLEEIRGKHKYQEFLYAYWSLDFTTYLLKKHIKSELEIKQYRERIIRQRTDRIIWEQDDYPFYRQLIDLFRKGTGAFFKEVDAYEEASETVVEAKKSAYEQKLEQLIKLIDRKRKVLQQEVLYVAAFFPNLKLSEFNFIVAKLVEDKVIPEKKEKKKKKAKTTIIKKKGKKKIIKEIKPIIKEEKNQISCKEKWEKETDDILKECFLRATYVDESSQQVIDFRSLGLRKDIQKYFRDDFADYLRRQFLSILRMGLLYQAGTPTNIVENLIQLVVRMAVNDPEENGERVLEDFKTVTRHIENDLKAIHHDIHKNKKELELIEEIFTRKSFEAIILGKGFDEEDFSSIVEEHSGRDEYRQKLKFLNKEVNKLRRIVMNRFSDLINEMLNYDALRNIVNRFLNSLLIEEDYQTIYSIIAMGRITSAEFDKLYWIKQLLHRAPQELDITQNTYRYLLGMIDSGDYSPYALLSMIRQWPGTQLFLPHLAIVLIGKVKENQLAIYPNPYPLFADINEDGELSVGEQSEGKDLEEEQKIRTDTGTWFRFLMQWIYDKEVRDSWYTITDIPNIPKAPHKRLLAFTHYLDNGGERQTEVLQKTSLDDVIGKEDLIEKWFMLLNGDRKEPIAPAAQLLVQVLHEELQKNSHTRQQKLEARAFLDYWRDKKMYYLSLINATDNKAKQQKIKRRRKILIQLISCFQICLKGNKNESS